MPIIDMWSSVLMSSLTGRERPWCWKCRVRGDRPGGFQATGDGSIIIFNISSKTHTVKVNISLKQICQTCVKKWRVRSDQNSIKLYFLDIVGIMVKLTAFSDSATKCGMSAAFAGFNFLNKWINMVVVTKPRFASSLTKVLHRKSEIIGKS